MWVVPGVAQTRQEAAFADFNARIAAYVDVTKGVLAGLPPLERTDDPAEIASREVAFGNAIRAGRARARPGDILTPEIEHVFRGIVKGDFRQRHVRERTLMLDEVPHFHPKVNQTYPSEWPLATFPPSLLAVLPALPDGLEYRLLRDALILRDTRANVIVDFILDVF
jgi:hypothetical protein